MKKFLLLTLILCVILVVCVSAEDKVFTFTSDDDLAKWEITSTSNEIQSDGDLTYLHAEQLSLLLAKASAVAADVDTATNHWMSMKYRAKLPIFNPLLDEAHAKNRFFYLGTDYFDTNKNGYSGTFRALMKMYGTVVGDEAWHTITLNTGSKTALKDLGITPSTKEDAEDFIKGKLTEIRFGFPGDEGTYVDVAYIGFFESQEAAEAYGKYEGSDPVVFSFDTESGIQNFRYYAESPKQVVTDPANALPPLMNEDGVGFVRLKNVQYMYAPTPLQFDTQQKKYLSFRYRRNQPAPRTFIYTKTDYFRSNPSDSPTWGALFRIEASSSTVGLPGDGRWYTVTVDMTNPDLLKAVFGRDCTAIQGLAEQIRFDWTTSEDNYVDLAYIGFFDTMEQANEYSAAYSTGEEAVILNFDEESDLDGWTFSYHPGLEGKAEIKAEDGVSFARISGADNMVTDEVNGLETSMYKYIAIKARFTAPQEYAETRYFYFPNFTHHSAHSDYNALRVRNGEIPFDNQWHAWIKAIDSDSNRYGKITDIVLTQFRFDLYQRTAGDSMDIEYIGFFKTQEDAEAYAARRESLNFALETLGAQVRSDDKPGLRFGSKLSSYQEDLYDDFEFGTLLLPAKILGDDELVIDTELAAVVPAVNIYESDDTGDTFTAVLTDIGDNEEVEIIARPYVRYKHMDTYSYVYGDTITRSMKSVKDAALVGWDK